MVPIMQLINELIICANEWRNEWIAFISELYYSSTPYDPAKQVLDNYQHNIANSEIRWTTFFLYPVNMNTLRCPK